jgi:voltage-gated potassium channel
LAVTARTRLILSLLGLLGVFVLGTGGYVLLTGASVTDAAYMTIITVSTVGYHEVVPVNQPGRLWTALVIVFGIGVVSVAFTSLLTLFVGGEFRAALGRRTVQARIDRLEGHVILCGFGRMGSMAAERLKQAGCPIVVVENSKAMREDLDAAGFLYVIGDAAEEETLLLAGLMRAGSLVSALPADADNVFVTLTARGLRPDLQIVARAEQLTAEVKLRRAGADRVICPKAIGAKRFADILTRPNVVDFFEVAAEGVELEMHEYRVGPGSKLCDATLRKLELRQQADAMVVAIKRANGTWVLHPDPDQVIQTGDLLVLIGRAGTSTRLQALDKA